MDRRYFAAAVLAASALVWVEGRTVHADGTTLFIRSALEHGDGTVTLPLYRGTSRGRTVWYVVLDASSSNDADRFGVNRAQKLANARGTLAVQQVTVRGGIVDFPATVDFSPVRAVVPGPAGFPPQIAEPGAVGETGYSPLIELPDGSILNAPQIANDTGQADKVVVLDTIGGSVQYRETDGAQGGRPVRYVSTDASDPAVAALENVTFAPLLSHAPFVGGDGTDSARASLAAFVNGQLGAGNPQRQGLNSALLDGLDPLNVLRWNPSQGRYSPLWDVHPAAWTATAIAAQQNVRQTDFGDIFNLVEKGFVTGPGGAPFGPAGFIVDCPIVSRQ
ncbi:MAG TPA: hypothetical protein VKE96_14665 [Vicinamibacterales bacterium]|nr:hypothetical protein [Vicinamibacterales bacterium]